MEKRILGGKFPGCSRSASEKWGWRCRQKVAREEESVIRVYLIVEMAISSSAQGGGGGGVAGGTRYTGRGKSCDGRGGHFSKP